VNSRAKGKAGELELAAYLRDRGFEARRGIQFSGAADSPDVVGIPGVHIECKRVEAGQLYGWLGQAIRDAGPDKTPVVFHRRSRCDWVVVMRADDFLKLLPATEPENW